MARMTLLRMLSLFLVIFAGMALAFKPKFFQKVALLTASSAAFLSLQTTPSFAVNACFPLINFIFDFSFPFNLTKRAFQCAKEIKISFLSFFLSFFLFLSLSCFLSLLSFFFCSLRSSNTWIVNTN